MAAESLGGWYPAAEREVRKLGRSSPITLGRRREKPSSPLGKTRDPAAAGKLIALSLLSICVNSSPVSEEEEKKYSWDSYKSESHNTCRVDMDRNLWGRLSTLNLQVRMVLNQPLQF